MSNETNFMYDLTEYVKLSDRSMKFALEVFFLPLVARVLPCTAHHCEQHTKHARTQLNGDVSINMIQNKCPENSNAIPEGMPW